MDEGKVKVVLVGLFSCATVYYSVQSVFKFKEHKISESGHRKPAGETIAYPSMTICSGFRDGRVTPVLIATEKQNSTEDSVDLLGYEQVKKFGYNRSEYITYFTQAVDDFWLNNLLDDDDLWTEEFHEHYGGRCATFNPVNETKPGQTNSIIFGLRWPQREYTYNCDGFTKEDCFYYFAVFFHPKDGFIYNKGNKFIGQSFLYPTSDARVYYTMERKHTTLLNKDYEACNPSINISQWRNCIEEAYDKKAGCIYPWKVRNAEDRPKACNLSQTHSRLSSIEHHTWWDIDAVVIKQTNCLKPCSFDEHKLSRLQYERPLIPGGWVFSADTQAAVQIFYADTVVETTEEYVAYDAFSLLGEIGGVMGLFLGWSMLQVVYDANSIVQSLVVKRSKKKKGGK